MTSKPARLVGHLAQLCEPDWTALFDTQERERMRTIVRTAFLDTTACILAARDEEAVIKIAKWAGATSSKGPVHLPVRAESSRPAMAALVNGTAGHALDYDDVGLAGHPSGVLVPALMAIHDVDRLRGFALVQSYAKGYAVWAELQARMAVHLHARGWHPTAVFGTVAAAAAVASARRLPSTSLAHAIGIAASCASGLIANFGSMTKALQVGRAARAGVEAAELAALGIDSSPDALDGSTGLLAALGGPGNARLDTVVDSGFESTLLRQPPGIKKYPVCYAAHRVIDGVLDLKKDFNLVLENVAVVDATISATTAAVLRHHRPETLAEARFSLEYVVAIALLHAGVGLQEVNEPSLADAAVRALMGRVHTHTVDTRCPLEPSFAYEDRVTITTTDGVVLDSGPIRFARGHAQRPVADSELRVKLLACMGTDDEALADAVICRIDEALAD